MKFNMQQDDNNIKNNAMRIKLSFSAKVFRMLLLVFGFAYYPLAHFVSGIFYHLPMISNISNYIVPLIIIILIFINLPLILKTLTTIDIFAFFAFLFIIFLSYILYPENAFYINQNMRELMVQAIPYYFLGLIWMDNKETFFLIYKVSFLAIIINLFYFLFFVSKRAEFNYNMTYAYAILPSIMVCMWWMFNERKKMAIIGVGMGLFYLLFLGTRGPIVIFVCYSAFILWNKFRIKGKIILIFIVGFLAFFVINTKITETIIKGLSLFGSSRGYSTRIFDIVSRNEFFSYTSGRSEYYEILKSKIKERPLLGYGIYGDWQFVQNPAHRIWLEIWSHYGIVFGTILIIFLIGLIYKGIECCSNNYIKGFIWIWVIHILIRGIFGTSYLGYYCFFLWGLCVNQIRKNGG